MRSDGKIFVLDADNRIEPFEAQNHLAEDWLQVLAQEHPEILAGGRSVRKVRASGCYSLARKLRLATNVMPYGRSIT